MTCSVLAPWTAWKLIRACRASLDSLPNVASLPVNQPSPPKLSSAVWRFGGWASRASLTGG